MLIENEYRPKDFQHKIYMGLQNINKNDVLIHLGDICIGDDSPNNLFLTSSVDCKKILVRGNHDNKSDSWYYEHGWDFVCDLFVLKKFGKRIVFSHEPIPQHGADLNIHGHWHDNDHRIEPDFYHWYGDKHRLLALEHTNYKPVELHKFLNQ